MFGALLLAVLTSTSVQDRELTPVRYAYSPAARGYVIAPLYPSMVVPTLAEISGGSFASGTSTNLAAPSANTDLGAAATPYRDLYIYGSGTFGTTSLKLTGTPTAARTITFPDSTGTVLVTTGSQTVTGTKTMSGAYWLAANDWGFRISPTEGNGLIHSTTQTPDGTVLEPGATSNSMHVLEVADHGVDFGNCSAGSSAATDPEFCVHSHNQTTTQWISLRHDGTNGVLDTGAGIVSIPDGVTLSGSSTVSGGNFDIASSSNLLFGSTQHTLRYTTVYTPDSVGFGMGALSNSLHLVEAGDLTAFDFANGPCGTAACTDPQMIVHSHNQNATEFRAVGYYGLAGRSVKTLAEGVATSAVRLNVAAEAGGAGEYQYAIYATDGSTPQIRSGRLIFSVTNDGGAETCVLGTPEETDNTPTGTLTVTITCDVSPTNAVDIQLNATSSLSQTTLEAYSMVNWVGAGEVVPQ